MNGSSRRHYDKELASAKEDLIAVCGAVVLRAVFAGDWRAAIEWLARWGGPEWQKPEGQRPALSKYVLKLLSSRSQAAGVASQAVRLAASSMLTVRKNDKRFIVAAASHAQRAVDYLHSLQPQQVEQNRATA